MPAPNRPGIQEYRDTAVGQPRRRGVELDTLFNLFILPVSLSLEVANDQARGTFVHLITGFLNNVMDHSAGDLLEELTRR